MSSATDRLSRLLILSPWLRAHPGVATDVVLDEFGLTADELLEDLKLASVCGVPGGTHEQLFDIDFYPDDIDDDEASDVTLGPTITVIEAQSLQRPMRLAPTEAATLLLGLRLLADLPGAFDRERLDGVTARLEAIASDAAEQLDEAVAVGEQRTVDAGILQTLRDAIADRAAVRLEYLVPSRDEVTERIVDPIAIGVTEGHHYVTAWCHTAEARRTFRIDRMLSVAPTGEPIRADLAVPTADDPYRYTPESGALQAVIRLEPAALWVLEHAIVDEVTELDAGAVQAVLTSSSAHWLAQLVLRAGPGAQVVEPPALRALVREQAEAALAAHAG